MLAALAGTTKLWEQQVSIANTNKTDNRLFIISSLSINSFTFPTFLIMLPHNHLLLNIRSPHF